MESTIAAVTFLSVIRTIGAQIGLEEGVLISHAGIDPEAFSRDNERIPAEKLSQIFQFAMQESGDPDLALHIGESVPYQSLGLLGYLLINAGTVGEMLEKFNRYQKIIGERLKFHFEDDGKQYRIALQIQGNPVIPVPRFHAEVHLSAIINIINQIAGKNLQPDRACFWHEKPTGVEGYRKLFGNHLTFEAQESAIYLSKSGLEVPLQFSNPAMLKYFEAQANRVLEDIEEKSVYSNVKQVILQYLGEEAVDIEFVAHKLGVSIRVLQKRLKEEKRTFRDALNQVRSQLATHYIRHTDMDMGSIALFLGYSEASAFLRAYKKQTGKRPGEIRYS